MPQLIFFLLVFERCSIKRFQRCIRFQRLNNILVFQVVSEFQPHRTAWEEELLKHQQAENQFQQQPRVQQQSRVQQQPRVQEQSRLQPAQLAQQTFPAIPGIKINASYVGN